MFDMSFTISHNYYDAGVITNPYCSPKDPNRPTRKDRGKGKPPPTKQETPGAVDDGILPAVVRAFVRACLCVGARVRAWW